jgi:hypothetical protein
MVLHEQVVVVEAAERHEEHLAAQAERGTRPMSRATILSWFASGLPVRTRSLDSRRQRASSPRPPWRSSGA